MRFCRPFTLTAGARGRKQAPPSHPRIGLQCDQPCSIVFSPCAIFPGQTARSTSCPKNLTEFPFAHNFSKPDLEVLGCGPASPMWGASISQNT